MATKLGTRVNTVPTRFLGAGGLAVCLGVMYFTDEYLSRRKREAALELEPSATTNLRRVAISPRDSSFKKRFAEFGFTFHDMPGVSYNKGTVLSSAASSLPRPLRMIGFERVTEPYWHESAAYEVTPEGMSSVEEASHEIHSMCLEAVDEIVNDGHLLTQFGIPRELHAAVKHSWSTRQCDLVGRLDFLWDGEGAPKFAEYNADTPTVMLEAGPAQQSWLDDALRANKLPAGAGQFNVLEPALVAAFARLQEQARGSPRTFKMITTAQEATEDLPFEEERATAQYMCRCAQKAGLNATFMNLEDFAKGATLQALLDAADGRYSEATTPSIAIWKLYPYEWLVNETLSVALQYPYLDGHVRFLEPAWKLIFSSKAILAYLWKKHPGHKNLLPAYFSASELENYKLSDDSAHWVAKPRFGREGDGIKYSNCEDSNFSTFEEFHLDTAAHQDRLLPHVEHPDDGDEKFSTDASDLEKVKTALISKVRDRTSKIVAERAVHGLLDHKYGGTHTAGNEAPPLSLNQGPPIFQQYHAPARLQGRSVVTSCWVVRGAPVAACFREDTAKTTNNDSCFVPHYVAGPRLSDAGFYPMSEKAGELRGQLYGSDPLRSDGVPAYDEGGVGRAGSSTTGGGGVVPVVSRPWYRGGGWFGGRQPSSSWGTTGQSYGTKGAGRERHLSKTRRAGKGGVGSTGATGKAQAGFDRRERTARHVHRTGATGRTVGRRGYGGGGG